ncbi:hypothetical protein [Alicyclobacillus kakegawensis]|uniref:hypothetical protein n=1 Tax=Alicyclobacillus kakegawensis TaxID=392012 RepID=UPI0008296387|nr:hypothetical protein [Alicyclobacillus kakegawensis]
MRSCGRLIEKREKNKERARKSRQRNHDARATYAHATRNVREACDATIQNLTIPNQTKKDLAPSAAADGASERIITDSLQPGGAQSTETGKGESLQGQTSGTTETPAPAEKPGSEYTREFEDFWRAYPRKVEKKGAYKAWKARLREGVPARDLIAAARHYAEDCSRRGTEMSFIKHAKTFLGPSKPYEEYIRAAPEPETPKQNKVIRFGLLHTSASDEEMAFRRKAVRQAYEHIFGTANGWPD